MYEIEVFASGWDEQVDMDAVVAALADLMTADQYTNSGTLAREHNSVYVQFGTVADAVKRIHDLGLGYTTDEDNDFGYAPDAVEDEA